MTGPLVVLGDALLDRDVHGDVERFTPDAPAPVLEESGAVDRPGGAALAAALAARDGDEVCLITALGDDPAGRRLTALLTDCGVRVLAAPASATPEKIRLRTHGQTLLRLDRQCAQPEIGELPPEAEAALAAAEAVLVSDYGRGLTSIAEVRRWLAVAAAERPVVWDPHPRGASPVPGLRLVTPNERELPPDTDGGSSPADGGPLAQLTRRAVGARQEWRAAAVCVTRAADGALLVDGRGVPLAIPAPAHVDGDACGAGDRLAATATRVLAAGGLASEAAHEAVRAATAFVATGAATTWDTAPPPSETGGLVLDITAARRMVDRVRAAGGQVVATGGCFDLLHAGHVATLQAARGFGDCLIVCLNSDDGVRALKGPDRPVVGEADRARVLAALSCVDAVVLFDEPTPIEVLTALRPDVWVKGGDYSGDELPENEHLARWGGQTVVVPYLDGHSTTRLINLAGRIS
ncbi:MAG: D-glycero-beta-D-manno-heptose 1-phosphate adenylyltransferase [Hamadaea sp.]|nr:D-glycero-beta-D-manno-heptose 1-phosphate adenylyltransferase [Hamadaea sp.]